MNFRMDGASRSFEVMVWISEIASAKSIAELKTSKNHYERIGGSWFWDSKRLQDTHQLRFRIWGCIWWTMFRNRHALSHGQTGRMDDLHEFQCHRHRWVCFGHQWDCQRRIGKWHRPVVQHAIGAKPSSPWRKNNWKVGKSVETSVWTVGVVIAVVVAVHSRDMLFKRVKLETTSDWKRWMSCISNRKSWEAFLFSWRTIWKARFWRCRSRGQVLGTGLL